MFTSHAVSPLKLVLAFALSVVSMAAVGQSSSHEPTSATDGEVRIHDGKKTKSVFPRTSRRNRSTERQGEAFESAGNFKTNVRHTDRHGKPITRPKQRIRHRNWNMARVFSRHNHVAKKESTRSRSRTTRRPN